jgi:hypothetical protein
VFAARRVPRADVPSGDAFTAWLDNRWIELDEQVDQLLRDTAPQPRSSEGTR